LFINRYRGNRVFDRDAGAVEDNDFIVGGAPRFAACDDFGQLGVDIFLSHQTLSNRVVRVPDGAGLLEAVGNDFGGRHQRRIDFLFVGIIRADRRDECAGNDVFLAHEEFVRCRAGNANVALLERRRESADRLDF